MSIAAAMGGALHFGIKAHHLEDDIHSVLKMVTYTVQHIRGLFFVHQIVQFIYSPAQALPSKKPWEYRPKPEAYRLQIHDDTSLAVYTGHAPYYAFEIPFSNHDLLVFLDPESAGETARIDSLPPMVKRIKLTISLWGITTTHSARFHSKTYGRT
mgnify:CR=1 FL=1